MSDCITSFFNTWQIDETKTRLASLISSATQTLQYNDPRTPEIVNGIAA